MLRLALAALPLLVLPALASSPPDSGLDEAGVDEAGVDGAELDDEGIAAAERDPDDVGVHLPDREKHEKDGLIEEGSGRPASRLAGPPQIRTCGTTASGSSGHIFASPRRYPCLFR